jgi:hypothetical protein
MRGLVTGLLWNARGLRRIAKELERIGDLLQLSIQGATPPGAFRTFSRASGGDSSWVGYCTDEASFEREREREEYQRVTGRRIPEWEAVPPVLPGPGVDEA